VLDDYVLLDTFQGIEALGFFVLDKVDFTHLTLSKFANDVQVLKVNFCIVAC